MDIKEFMKKQGKELKPTDKVKPSKTWKTMSTDDKLELLHSIAIDLGYINKEV